MAGSIGPNCGGRGQRARPTVTNKKRTEDKSRRHHGSDAEKEPDEEESLLEKAWTSKDGHRNKKMSKANWASEEEDNDSIGKYQVSNHEDERTLEEALAHTRKEYKKLWDHCGNFKKEIQALQNKNQAMKMEVMQVGRENHELEEKV
jgi:hypothetical protein